MTYAKSNGHVTFDLEKLGQGQLMIFCQKGLITQEILGI